jgi:hypothetical protein
MNMGPMESNHTVLVKIESLTGNATHLNGTVIIDLSGKEYTCQIYAEEDEVVFSQFLYILPTLSSAREFTIQYSTFYNDTIGPYNANSMETFTVYNREMTISLSCRPIGG